jgi:uncharacterized phiE125 gp8 family phage protein
MMMVELTSVPSAALPVDALADHLRLSSGFADDGSQTAQLESCLRSAMAAIEARIGKALIARGFALTLEDWNTDVAHVLPIAPVSGIDAVRLVSRTGAESIADAARYRLQADTHRPKIVATAGALPRPGSGGSIVVELTAGFAADAAGVPQDLFQAWLALAADYYNRVDPGASPVSASVRALLEPHRQIRLSGSAS